MAMIALQMIANTSGINLIEASQNALKFMHDQLSSSSHEECMNYKSERTSFTAKELNERKQK